MARLLNQTKAQLGGFIVLFLPLGLWGMLWLGIAPGSIRDVFNPESFTQFLHGLRAAAPFVALGVAALFMLVQFPNRDRGKLFFFSPLAFLALYGLVGTAVSLRSPDTSLALYWASLYLTVPLILWAAMWSPNSPLQIQRIIQFNWLIIGIGFLVLFVIGLISLNLDQAILNPTDLLRCQGVASWFQHTSGVLRSTGVGRFAAVTGIITLSLVWNGKTGVFWGIVFLASLALLLSTGARGSMVSFAAAIPVVYWLMSGKRSKIGAGICLVILVPILWSTGGAETFFRGCLLKESAPDQIEYLKLRSPDQVSSSQTLQAPEPTPPPHGLFGWDVEGFVIAADVEDDPSSSVVYSASGRTQTSGRTQIWAAGWKFIELSPVLGYGFHADRLVLGTHMHNAVLHAMIQTGLLGTIPFVGAILWAWFLLIKTLRKIGGLDPIHKTAVIQSAGILVFLSFRSLPESTGAFFGIDWLLLSPLLLYLRLVNSVDATMEEGA